MHVQQTLANPESPNAGIPRNMTTIATKLRESPAAYKTHIVGKYDAVSAGGCLTVKAQHTRGRGGTG